MASAPIKFRCYRCNQLLGVARSKAGAVVACPKCQVEVVVPQPEDGAARPSLTNSSGSGDGGISLDVLNIRPEDIRVEPGANFAPAPATVLVEPAPPNLSTDEMMTAGEVDWPVADSPPVPVRAQAPPPPAPAPVHPPVAASFQQRHAVAPRHGEEPSILPAIQIETHAVFSRSGSAAGQVRSRDLVLPRSVVASWSLLVLFGIAFAFMTGLLAGHFVWRN